MVGAVGCRKAVQMVVAPSITYGSASLSIPRVNVKMLRTEMAKTYGPIHGGSITARLLIEGVDPQYGLVEKAVMMWACAV